MRLVRARNKEQEQGNDEVQEREKRVKEKKQEIKKNVYERGRQRRTTRDEKVRMGYK